MDATRLKTQRYIYIYLLFNWVFWPSSQTSRSPFSQKSESHPQKNPCRSMPMIQTFLEFSLVVPKCRRFLNLVEGPTLDFFPRTNGLGFPSTFRPTLWCLQVHPSLGGGAHLGIRKDRLGYHNTTWQEAPPGTTFNMAWFTTKDLHQKHEISWNNHSLKIRRFSVTSTNH